MYRVLLVSSAAFMVLAASSASWADVAPPPDDETCYATEHESEGTDCGMCSASQCETEYEGTNYEYRCTNEYEGREVWCEADDQDGCSAASAPATAPLAGLFLAAGLALAAWLTLRRTGA